MNTALYRSARKIFAPSQPKTEAEPLRPRFKVTHPELLPTEFIEQLEALINQSIQSDHPAEIPGTRISYE